LTAGDKIPASFADRDMVAAGVLMSYGTDIADMFRQVGVYTGSILEGAKPADLPVLQSTKFEFAINLQAARALDIEGPPERRGEREGVICVLAVVRDAHGHRS
jgi:putative tryptophan/tyrosine transport system substrate-binding protein